MTTVKNVKHVELSHTSDEGTNHLSLVQSFRKTLWHYLWLWVYPMPTQFYSRFYTQINPYVFSPKSRYKNCPSLTIHNSSKLKTTQMTTSSSGIHKLHVQAIGYCRTVRRDKLQLCTTRWMSLTIITRKERSQTRKEDYIPYDSTCIKFKSR